MRFIVRLIWLALALALDLGPLPIAAQQAPKVARIGYLSGTAPAAAPHEAFRQGLRELGYVEGKTVVLEVSYFPVQK